MDADLRMLRQFWRVDERLNDVVEQSVREPKFWVLLEELPPSIEHLDGYEAEVHLVDPNPRLARVGNLLLRGHQEPSGQIFIRLSLGNSVLRRGHVGAGHQEPDAGPMIPGPHIHYPTTVFNDIGRRGARSRAYPWEISRSISLREAISLFAIETGILGQPQEKRRLIGEP